jgi:hypothetical protein
MADATARVASLLAEAGAAAAAATIAGAVTTTAIRVAALAAVAGNVADLAALDVASAMSFPLKTTESHLVALSTGLAATGAAASRAVARDVAGLAATIAGLGVPRTLRAVTACLLSVIDPNMQYSDLDSLM